MVAKKLDHVCVSENGFKDLAIGHVSLVHLTFIVLMLIGIFNKFNFY